MKKNKVDTIVLSSPKKFDKSYLEKIVVDSLEKNNYSNLEKRRIISVFRVLYKYD